MDMPLFAAFYMKGLECCSGGDNGPGVYVRYCFEGIYQYTGTLIVVVNVQLCHMHRLQCSMSPTCMGGPRPVMGGCNYCGAGIATVSARVTEFLRLCSVIGCANRLFYSESVMPIRPWHPAAAEETASWQPHTVTAWLIIIMLPIKLLQPGCGNSPIKRTWHHGQPISAESRR
jgi:hypothetical protein